MFLLGLALLYFHISFDFILEYKCPYDRIKDMLYNTCTSNKPQALFIHFRTV